MMVALLHVSNWAANIPVTQSKPANARFRMSLRPGPPSARQRRMPRTTPPSGARPGHFQARTRGSRPPQRRRAKPGRTPHALSPLPRRAEATRYNDPTQSSSVSATARRIASGKLAVVPQELVARGKKAVPRAQTRPAGCGFPHLQWPQPRHALRPKTAAPTTRMKAHGLPSKNNRLKI